MNSYWYLAIRYLQQNKKRSLLTILGTAITVIILYIMLNTGYGYLVQTRKELRASADYEMVLFTETEEQITSILENSLVRSAYIGEYYSYIAGEGTMYENALYISTNHPYRMNAVFDELCSTYGVAGEIRDELAWTYLQGSEGDFIKVLIYFSVLVAFIFAIIGVGMIRNSIQLGMFENIRDYGNLRCIGSSKSELKIIIFIQGMLIEVTGIALGTIMATLVSMLLSYDVKRLNLFAFEGSFHILPFLLILAAFLIDLVFAMGETSKLVTNISPISAIRGEYRFRKEKLRLREKSLLKKLVLRLCGIDGDYAYKNLMRSPGRFWRTVGMMSFGIISAMMIMITIHSILKMLPEYGYYQMYIMNTWGIDESMSMIQTSLPSQEIMRDLSDIPEFSEVKFDYRAEVLTTSLDELSSHYTDEYRTAFAEGDYDNSYQDFMEKQRNLLENPVDRENTRPYLFQALTGLNCAGYDQQELSRCSKTLLEGTWDISDSGIILANHTKLPIMQETEGNTWSTVGVNEVPIYDYQIGDTIQVIDIKEFHSRIDDRLAKLNKEYSAKKDAALAQNPNDSDGKVKEIIKEYSRKSDWLVVDVWRELVDEGCYKTYTIEGIISEDPNVMNEYSDTDRTILMTKQAYYDLTGTNENYPTGVLYHMDRIPRRNMQIYLDDEYEPLYYSYDGMQYTMCEISTYMEMIPEIQKLRSIVIAVILVIIFLLTISVINMINATSSNLYLRRKEFAQLRVIGVSKRHLIKMVLLEGVIEAFVSSVIGTTLGGLFSYIIYLALHAMTIDTENPMQFYFPISTWILMIVISVIVVCGAIYVPIRRLGNDLVVDLKAGAD